MHKLHLSRALVVLLSVAFLAGCKANDRATERSSSNNNGATQTARSQPATTPAQRPNTAHTNIPAPTADDGHNHQPDGVRRVSVSEFQSMFERGEAIVVDVRDPDSFRRGRIKGALSIPSDQLEARISSLPKDKLIVFYCA